jgi:hypothetical protein
MAQLHVNPGLYKAGENHYYFLTGRVLNQLSRSLEIEAQNYSGSIELLSPKTFFELEPIYTTDNEYYVENYDNPIEWAKQMQKRGKWLEDKVKQVQDLITQSQPKCTTPKYSQGPRPDDSWDA